MLYRAFKVVAFLTALAAAEVGPVLPQPTGKYPVGRASYYMLDVSRDDERGTQKDHKREFWTQVWYPAQSGSRGKSAAWLLPEWVRLDPAARDASKYVSSVVVHAREDVPVAPSPGPFPVLLLAPGSISFPSKYSSLAEDLASHGFVVVGDAPVGNGITVPFPAGNVTPGYRGEMFALWEGDLIYELDQLKVWNETKGHLFQGRLDLNRIGAFGHSAGGLIVARVPHVDKRVKAVALLDPGYVEPQDGEAIPVLIFKSDAKDSPHAREKARREAEYVQRAKPGINLRVIGSEHASFSDLAVIPGFARPGDGRAFHDTIRAVLREFFGRYLRGEPSELLEKGADKFPLLKLEKNPLY